MAYDRSYSALFNPGSAADLFKLNDTIGFEPDRQSYSHANAWWLAEFSRLVYKIDDQTRQSTQPGKDVIRMLDEIGFSLRNIVTDSTTSTRVALFDFPATHTFGYQPIRIVVFCGSNEALDWKMNFQAGQESFAHFGKVHQGFLKSLHSVAGRLLKLLNAEQSPVILAGHSLGAALATLMTVELKRQGIPPLACYSYGCPRIGNRQFVDSLSNLPVYRIVNNCDLVSCLPISMGSNEYLQPDGAIFFDQEGGVSFEVTDMEVQQRQAAYFPALKRYLEAGQLMSRFKTLSSEVPGNFADHAVVNYTTRIAAQLLS